MVDELERWTLAAAIGSNANPAALVIQLRDALDAWLLSPLNTEPGPQDDLVRLHEFLGVA